MEENLSTVAVLKAPKTFVKLHQRNFFKNVNLIMLFPFENL